MSNGSDTSPAEQEVAPTGAAETAKRIARGTRDPQNWLQLVKFGAVGASGYIVNLCVFALLTELADLHHILAAIGAFMVAVSNNFFWNRHWTFGAAGGHAGFQAARFLAISVLALGINLIVLELLVQSGTGEFSSQAVAVAVAMPFNFIGNKLWTFA